MPASEDKSLPKVWPGRRPDHHSCPHRAHSAVPNQHHVPCAIPLNVESEDLNPSLALSLCCQEIKGKPTPLAERAPACSLRHGCEKLFPKLTEI